MNKSDKELATDIICSYINAWGTQNNCIPVKSSELPGLIQSVYNAIHSLDESEKE